MPKQPTALDAAVEWRPKVWPDLIVDRTDAAGRPGGEHAVLLHPRKAYWALTNETGVMLAQWCDGTRTAEDLAGELAEAFGLGDAELVRGDVASFLEDLRRARLLERDPPGVPAPDLGPVPSQDGPEFEYNLAIFLTEQCNLRCRHCFVVEGKMPDDALATADVLRLIDEHARLHPRISVAFSGGEVTLHPDWLRIVEHAASRAGRTIVCTNALLLDAAQAERLGELDVEVQVSLDGPDPEVHDFIRGKGSFERTWAALEMLARAMPEKLHVSCTLTRSMVGHVRRLIERIDALGAGKLRFLPLLKQRAADTNWKEIAPDPEALKETYRYLLLELPREERIGKTKVAAGFPGYVPEIHPEAEAWCPLGRMTLVGARGEAYNCPSMNIPEFQVGNVREQSLEEIQRSERNEELRREIMARRYAVPACAECAWRNFCQGSCTAISYLKTNDLYVTDEFCEFRRELYRRHVLKAE